MKLISHKDKMLHSLHAIGSVIAWSADDKKKLCNLTQELIQMVEDYNGN